MPFISLSASKLAATKMREANRFEFEIGNDLSIGKLIP